MGINVAAMQEDPYNDAVMSPANLTHLPVAEHIWVVPYLEVPENLQAHEMQQWPLNVIFFIENKVKVNSILNLYCTEVQR